MLHRYFRKAHFAHIRNTAKFNFYLSSIPSFSTYFTKSKNETNGYIAQFLDNPLFDVLLGCTCALKGYDIPGTSFTRATQSSMTSFFIAKRNIIDALIASHKESIRSFGKDGKRKGIHLDHMWYNLMKIFVFVTPYFKPLGAQLEDYSDIRKKKMNYSNYIKIV